MVPRKTVALCFERSCVYSVWKRRRPLYIQYEKIASCVYSVWNRRRPAYTQYEKISLVTTIILNYTEYPQDVVFFMLSIRRTWSFSYWVYAGRCLNYTEYKLETNFAFGQTKSPLTHLNSLSIRRTNRAHTLLAQSKNLSTTRCVCQCSLLVSASAFLTLRLGFNSHGWDFFLFFVLTEGWESPQWMWWLIYTIYHIIS